MAAAPWGRIYQARRDRHRACGARSHPLRRRHQLAALLMLSGIGDPDELAAHDIAVKVALPGVGKNLQDHISASVALCAQRAGPVPQGDAASTASCRRWRAPICAAKALPPDCRPASMAFLKSRPDAALARRAIHLQRRADDGAPICGRSAALMPMLMPAAPWCCGRRAGAGSNSSPPIRDRHRASGRTFSPPTTTGKRCAPGCAWRAKSAGRRRWRRSWPRDRARRQRHRGRRSRRPYPRQLDHRSSPARHLQNGHRLRSAGGGRSANCACSAPTGFALSTAR